jgi:uncharacterized membrane protein YhhN
VLYRLLADAVLAAHLAFIVFVVAGGLLALVWRRVAWLHVPMALWGVAIEVVGWTCPLTPLENALRRAAGEQGYAGGFLEHYVFPLIYPGDLSRADQALLGMTLLAFNAAVYLLVWRRARR